MARGELETAGRRSQRQRGEAARRVGLQQGIKPLLAVVGQHRGELPIGFGLGPGPRLGHEALQPRHPRTEELLGAEFLAEQLIEQGRFVMLQRPLQEPSRRGVRGPCVGPCDSRDAPGWLCR